MPAAFDSLEKTTDVVDLEALAKPEVGSFDTERRHDRTTTPLEAGAQCIVDDGLHRTTGSAHLSLDPDGDVVVEGQRRSGTHIMKSTHQAS